MTVYGSSCGTVKNVGPKYQWSYLFELMVCQASVSNVNIISGFTGLIKLA